STAATPIERDWKQRSSDPKISWKVILQSPYDFSLSPSGANAISLQKRCSWQRSLTPMFYLILAERIYPTSGEAKDTYFARTFIQTYGSSNWNCNPFLIW